jgi:hypothetical protein
METAVAVALLAVAALLLFGGSGLVVLSKRGNDDAGPPALGTDSWPVVEGDVVSVLKVGGRNFLMVDYRVGSDHLRNDVMNPTAGPAPIVGQRVHVRYNPAAPARVVLVPDAATAPQRTTRRRAKRPAMTPTNHLPHAS